MLILVVARIEGFVEKPLYVSHWFLTLSNDRLTQSAETYHGYPQYKVLEKLIPFIPPLHWVLLHHGRQLLSDLWGDLCLPWSKRTNNTCNYPRQDRRAYLFN